MSISEIVDGRHIDDLVVLNEADRNQESNQLEELLMLSKKCVLDRSRSIPMETLLMNYNLHHQETFT